MMIRALGCPGNSSRALCSASASRVASELKTTHVNAGGCSSLGELEHGAATADLEVVAVRAQTEHVADGRGELLEARA